MRAIEIGDVHARYGKHIVLHGVNLTVAAGEWSCLLGPNGVGKTTLLHCIAGRVVPAQGTIRIAGHSLSAAPQDAKRRLGYACAPDQLPGLLTGRQCLEVYAFAKELSSIDVNILKLAEELRFTRYLDAYVDTYSLGTRQKLCILLALLGEPALIVFDEAFNGLDPRSAIVLKAELAQRLQQGSAVLLATHSLDIVERYAQHAALMIDGRILQEWNAHQIAGLRSEANGFENALASASEAQVR